MERRMMKRRIEWKKMNDGKNDEKKNGMTKEE